MILSVRIPVVLAMNEQGNAVFVMLANKEKRQQKIVIHIVAQCQSNDCGALCFRASVRRYHASAGVDEPCTPCSGTFLGHASTLMLEFLVLSCLADSNA